MSDAAGGKMRVGVDVGGTFTDLVSWDGEGLRLEKLPSTPPDFEKGVAAAVSGVVNAADAADMIHGSTVATNALLERRGGPAALLVTEGFRDVLMIGRQNRPELYALEVRRPPPVIPRELCFEVPERTSPDGEPLRDVDDAAVDAAAREIASRGVRHVAVCLLFSFANAAHEKQVAEICRRHGLTVTLSSDVLPEFREYERANTTVVTAFLRPTVETYLGRLRETLPANVSDIRILHGGGGTFSVEDAAANAGRLTLSGPAGGVAGAALMARLAGEPNAVGFDMGGTSTDVALIRDGRPQFSNTHVFDGLPVALPMLDIHTVGAGGGSIASLDAGGALRVGPRSAGANPGPACYGRGGESPTVTDANVILGRIPAGASFGGLTLRPELAEQAFVPLAEKLGTDIRAAAEGVLKVVEQNMAGAVRAVTTRRGHDPRTMALVSFGGAGGLHACAVAQFLGMTRVILPPMAGVLSALGMVIAADSVDVSQTTLQLERRGKLDDSRLAAEFGRLNMRAIGRVPTGKSEPLADCRWSGQSHELTVPVTRPSRDAIAASFAAVYRQTYGEPPPDRGVEIVTLRLRRVGPEPAVTLPQIEPDAGERRDATVWTRPQLVHARAAAGPLLLVDPDATAFIPAGWSAKTADTGIVTASRM